MNYEKIGKFISQLRKEQKLTQSQLAEKLNVTNKAVSKWETGLGAPDISLLGDLSKILNVSVNELLLGERINLLTRECSDNILSENIKLYNQKSNKKNVKLFLFIFLMIVFFIFSLIVFNASMIISKLYLYIVFLILSCLFVSILFFIKIVNVNYTKVIILISCIGYTVSLFSYALYTGISYNLNNIIIDGFDVNIIPFKTIITSFYLVITKAQPVSLLFDYFVIDLFLFTPYSLFIPYLIGKKFNHKTFFPILLIIIFIKE